MTPDTPATAQPRVGRVRLAGWRVPVLAVAPAAGLLRSYDHGPGRRPDISLNGDDEDTADVIAEILDDETALESEDGIGCHGGIALSRESPAAFMHDLVLKASAWLAQDAAEVDRFAGD